VALRPSVDTQAAFALLSDVANGGAARLAQASLQSAAETKIALHGWGGVASWCMQAAGLSQ
jgi:tRNA A37 threonylcarbamoyladenosine dehydratase